MQLMLQFETQNTKSFCNAHFSVEMRQVNRYYNQTYRNITTDDDMTTASEQHGGIASTVVRLMSL